MEEILEWLNSNRWLFDGVGGAAVLAAVTLGLKRLSRPDPLPGPGPIGIKARDSDLVVKRSSISGRGVGIEVDNSSADVQDTDIS